jgi:lipid-A-disaccharide synthase
MSLPFPVRGEVFVSAGEPSADLYAAHFIKRLKKDPLAIKVLGIGGPEMKAAGVELLDDFRGLMAFGLSAAAGNARSGWSIYRKICRALYQKPPDIFLPVAYPGMNLLLCRYARRLGIKTIYLLPPQIWAWGGFRKHFIRKWVDLVITFFPFEYDHYRSLGFPVRLVDNPIISLTESIKRTDPTRRIGLMPGSRPGEVKRNLPVIMKLMDKIKGKVKDVRFIIISREKIDLPQEVLVSDLPTARDRYQAMKNCDLLVTCSGTASLEAAICGVPQLFFNRPSWVDYHITRRLVSTKEFNLANLYFNKKIVPVYIDRNTKKLVSNMESFIQKTVSSPTAW